MYYSLIASYIIKPGVRRSLDGMHLHGFLKLLLSGKSVYIRMCACPLPRLLKTIHVK